jgi:hypothetical protein
MSRQELRPELRLEQAQLFPGRGFALNNNLNFPLKGELMKKLFTLACTLVLGGALSFAQAAQTPAAGGSTTTESTSTDAPKAATGKKKASHKKGAKKSKKSAGDATATAPK